MSKDRRSLKKIIENDELEEFELRAFDEEEEFENFLIGIITQIVELRMKKGITQKELAERMNTKQSVISRFENISTNPTLKSLYKMLKVLGGTIKIVDAKAHEMENYDMKFEFDEFYDMKFEFDEFEQSREELKSLEMAS